MVTETVSAITTKDDGELAMKLLKPPPPYNNFPFFNDLFEDGYHIFNLENAKIPDFYPSKFLDYPGVNLKDLTVGDVITIRAFFRIGSGKNIHADGGYIDLEIEHIEGDTVWGVILTSLPKGFPLRTGSSVEIFQDEILYKADRTEN